MPLPELNTSANYGIREMMQFPSESFPFFWPLIQFAIFTIITLSTYFSETERKGEGNFLSSLAVAGFTSIVLGTILNLLQFIDRTTFIITFVLGILFIVLYMLTDR